MAGIGDELLLLLGAAHHGVDGPAGQQHHQQQHQQRAAHIRQQRPQQQQTDGAELLVAVQKDGHVLVVPRVGHEEAVAAAASVARAVFQRGGQILRRVRVCHRGDLGQVGQHQRAVVLIAQNEIPGGKGGLRREVTVPLIGAALWRLRRRHVPRVRQAAALIRDRDGALILVDQRQGTAEVAVGGHVVDHVQDHRKQQHHRRHRQGGDADKAAAQPFDHVSSSNT